MGGGRGNLVDMILVVHWISKLKLSREELKYTPGSTKEVEKNMRNKNSIQ